MSMTNYGFVRTPLSVRLGLVIALSTVVCHADKIWPVVEDDAHLQNFHFQSGPVMADLRIHYRTLGVPRRDRSGRVRNAVLILHGTGGSGGGFLRDTFAGELFGPDQPLDVARYFVILPDAIGHGQSSKPSDGMRARFPHYGYNDMVEAQHRLLVDQLHVDHARIVIGMSMGCMHTYLWAEKYPDFMDAALPLACQPAEISGRNLFWRLSVIHAIRSDPTYNGGDYTENPPGARSATLLTNAFFGNPLTWQTSYPTREKGLEEFAKTLKNEVPDANDMLYQVDASWDYKPAPDLAKIRTPVLHINFADDTINPPELRIAENLLKQVPSARFVLFPYTPDSRGHQTHGIARLWKDKLADFLQSTERTQN